MCGDRGETKNQKPQEMQDGQACRVTTVRRRVNAGVRRLPPTRDCLPRMDVG
jgi:hypothetical protein